MADNLSNISLDECDNFVSQLPQNSSVISLEEHMQWAEDINRRLSNLYKDLCEYEQLVNKQPESELMELFELFESVNEVEAAAKNISTKALELHRKRDDMQDQMLSLERSVDLLKLNDGMQE